ncbi:MAG TPA: UDP-N-acetylglucosamine 1-carboxyvinyltransferase [Candidatus Babeliales bacterium]|jgi:UDP-N-acetylglucosamine 1-carboxyvinyltransferase|nr:UDP-N-acetylglucosamine 1-carboxyvinyltransferase [Candidatus Babeliales bacterium]
MNNGYLKVEQSPALQGEVKLSGAKNAVLVTIASLILTAGKSLLHNVPVSADVFEMIELLRHFGAVIFFDTELHQLFVDTTSLHSWDVSGVMMKKTRTSILVMGPLLARFGKVRIGGMPGGDAIGKRPIDYHLKNFVKMGVAICYEGDDLCADVEKLCAAKIVLEYPSVGATENIIMAATRTQGTTKIINAACEPEVFNLIACLTKMGANIKIEAPATITIEGVDVLNPVEHSIMCDRLEAGSLLIAAAATGGEIYIPDASADVLDVFLMKLEEMGHTITIGENGKGIYLQSIRTPRAVSFKTGPYPQFPTDLQPPMMALQCMAQGTSIIEETVFENRFHHAHELIKMGASIKIEHNKTIITGVEKLYGTQVVAADIRAAMALVVAGLTAQGTTTIAGLHHWKRGYEALENKLQKLGANVTVHEDDEKIIIHENKLMEKHGFR